MSFTGDSQVSRAIDSKTPTDAPPSIDPNAPLVPFPSSLVLDREAEDSMVTVALARIGQLEIEMGRNLTISNNWYESENPERPTGGRTFMGKRDYYELAFNNKVEWRKWAIGGIFAESNLTLPVTRRIVRQMIARAVEYFFATDPWFNSYPVASADTELAETLEKHSRWKIQTQTNVKAQLIKAVQNAFVRGESVIKTTFKNRDSIYRSLDTIMVNADGSMIIGKDGNPINQSDQFVQGLDPMTQQPSGGFILQRDGVTPIPDDAVFAPQLITKKNNLYRGPDASVVYYKDFLCPLTAEDVQSADLIAHLYDLPVMALVDQYSRRDIMNPASTEEDVKNSEKMVDLLRMMVGSGGTPKTGRNMPRREWGELQNDNGIENPTCEIAEIYMSYDADGDGMPEEIMLVIDKRSRLPIFYDYLGNVTADGKRPFTTVRINPIDGRWHGVGGMEMFENSQQFIDLLINRRNFAESSAGRVTFWNPSKVIEGQGNKDCQLGNGETYTLLPTAKKEEALDYVVLPEVKGRNLFEIMEVFMQMMQLESGVINAMDQQASGLPSAKLATGVRSVDKSSSEMFSLFLEDLEPSLTEVLKAAVKIVYANMDATEIFTVTEGNAKVLLQLTPDAVRNLEIDVEMTLTKSKSEQVLESNVQAANLTNQFYSLAPAVQVHVASLYIQALKAMGIEQAETVIVPMPPPAPPQAGPDGQPVQDAEEAGEPPNGQKPSANIPINDPGQIMPVR